MEVKLAETAGFCMGVDMALKRLDKLVEEAGGRPIHILGPIIHNPQVLESYAQKGVITVDTPDHVPDGACVVIRAHGVPRQVEEEMAGRDVVVKDATCPRVKKAQLLIARHTMDGAILLLYGEEDHPEVKGLVSYAGDGHFVFDAPEALASYPFEPGRSYVLAAQTTQDRALFDEMAARLEADTSLDVTVLRTICDATRLRQQEASELADEVDFMVVVGGYNSGNTRRLVQVVTERGTPCVHVETAAELDPARLAGCARVGVTAGASTPYHLIHEVIRFLESL